MGKLLGGLPGCEFTTTDTIKYTGIIPECIPNPEDCTDEKSILTYLLSLLLERYCELQSIEDQPVTITLECLLENNPEITEPETITIKTLFEYYRDHICHLYENIQNELICHDDVTQIYKNGTATVSVLTNDDTSAGTGTVVVTITSNGTNGTATVNGSSQIVYTPDTDYVGNDTITYLVTKGTLTCTGRLQVFVIEQVVDWTEIIEELQSTVTNLQSQLNAQSVINSNQQNQIDYLLEHMYDCCVSGEVADISFEGSSFEYCYVQPGSSVGKLQFNNININDASGVASIEGITGWEVNITGPTAMYFYSPVKQPPPCPSPDISYVDAPPYTWLEGRLNQLCYSCPSCSTSFTTAVKTLGVTGTIGIYFRFTDTNGLQHIGKISGTLYQWSSAPEEGQCFTIAAADWEVDPGGL